MIPNPNSTICSSVLSLLLLGWLATSAGAAGEPARPQPDRDAESTNLFGETYPVEVRVSFQAALLHWLDSLTGVVGPGMTAGKTTEAHRLDFERVAGEPSAEDLRMLQRFAETRRSIAARSRGGAENHLARAVFEEPTLTAALGRAGPLVEAHEARELHAVFDYFTAHYERIWSNGKVVRGFVERARRDPAREALDAFMGRVAGFYGTDLASSDVPRLILVPVRDGHGTHAQAVGPDLLIEIRPGDGLGDQVPPIVHENSHFLFYGMDPERRGALRTLIAELGPEGADAWQVMLEALPTAIGQGVAGQAFRRATWSLDQRWYGREDVDRFAKAIFPLVRETLNNGGRLDRPFLEKALAAYRKAGVGRLSRRSP
jgi:hypothetical protein